MKTCVITLDLINDICHKDGKIASFADRIEKNEIVKISEKKSSLKSGRYVELLSIAEKDNLNHGNSWYASGMDVDRNQLHPSSEGEAICYVYAS